MHDPYSDPVGHRDSDAAAALMHAGMMTVLSLELPLSAWEAAARTPGLLPGNRKLMEAALAFRRAVHDDDVLRAPVQAPAPDTKGGQGP